MHLALQIIALHRQLTAHNRIRSGKTCIESGDQYLCQCCRGVRWTEQGAQNSKLVLMLTQNSKLKTQNSTTDWHCHLLPGIDDGAATVEESVAMARTLSAAGFTTVCCTPHMIKGSYERSAVEIRAQIKQLQLQLLAASIPLQLLAGAEYYLDEYLDQFMLDPLPLGDTKLLLVEIPNHTPVEFVKESCYRLKGRGYTPVIAHPERCRLLEPGSNTPDKNSLWGLLFTSKLKTQNSELLSHDSTLNTQHSTLLPYLQEIGCHFQGNLGSYVGYYGERVKANAERFRQMSLYSCFGSDGHSLEGLKSILQGLTFS